jgi:hypothetical protein
MVKTTDIPSSPDTLGDVPNSTDLKKDFISSV